MASTDSEEAPTFFERIERRSNKVLQRFTDLPEASQKAMLRLFELAASQKDGAVKEAETILTTTAGVHANVRHPGYGETLLNEALGSLEMVKLLLEHGADPNQGDMMDSQTPLDHIREREEEWDGAKSTYKDVKALLIQHGGKESICHQWIRADNDEDRTHFFGMLGQIDRDSLDGDDTEDEDDESN